MNWGSLDVGLDGGFLKVFQIIIFQIIIFPITSDKDSYYIAHTSLIYIKHRRVIQ